MGKKIREIKILKDLYYNYKWFLLPYSSLVKDESGWWILSNSHTTHMPDDDDIKFWSSVGAIKVVYEGEEEKKECEHYWEEDDFWKSTDWRTVYKCTRCNERKKFPEEENKPAVPEKIKGRNELDPTMTFNDYVVADMNNVVDTVNQLITCVEYLMKKEGK